MTRNTRPVGIDLFAGAGGMSLGFEQAGFDVAAAVEIDPVHCAVHKFNFPDTVVVPRSVVGLTAQEIRRLAGLGDRDIDCVFGGPPCQGFSLIGHRSLEDPRNSLVLEFVRLVKELDAKTFVFENVKGLTVGTQRAFLEELIVAFEDVGYVVRSPWQVLDAANFGVPQHRQRLILYGAKNGQKLHLETGQESADHLLEFIHDVNRSNLFINFDPANMILYGTGNPIEALKKVGHLVKSVHCKDAKWAAEPVRGKEWGCEVALGEGDVGMETYLRTLKEIGYQGPLTIEREIAHDRERQRRDIGTAAALLQRLRAQIL